MVPKYRRVSGVSLKSLSFRVEGGRESRGLVGKPEMRVRASGGVYGSRRSVMYSAGSSEGVSQV